MLQQNSGAVDTPAAIDSAVPGPRLTKAQERAIAALFESPSIESAARRAGVELASLRRWMRDDEGFQSKIREIRRKAHSDMKKRLQGVALAAIDDLIDRAQAKKLIEPGRVSLLRTAIEFAFRPPRYYTDIQERLTALENQQRVAEDSRGSNVGS